MVTRQQKNSQYNIHNTIKFQKMKITQFLTVTYFIFLNIFVVTAKTNILFIVIDDLRPVLNCYNDETAHTPNLNHLAQQSVVFNNAFAQQALCAPSRNSFLTSRRPDTLHLYDFYSYWRDAAGNFTTIPQYYKEHGYYTATFGKVFHPGISSNMSDDQPYSWSQTPFHPPTQKYMNSPVCRDINGRLKRNVVCPVVTEFQPGETLPDLETLEATTKFLRSIRNISETPFFLAVGFHKPHLPLKYPVQYKDMHPLEIIPMPKVQEYPPLLPSVSWNPWTDLRKREDIAALNVTFPFGKIPESYARLIKQSYYAAVTYIDDLIGDLINVVKEEGYFNDTVIIVIGDHGWSLAEHGEWAKYSNFEVAVQVPFILYVPGITDFTTKTVYKTSNALVELVDIFPTLVDITNLSQPLVHCPRKSKSIKLCTEGTSLSSLLRRLHHQEGNEDTLVNWKTGVFSQYPRPDIYPTEHPNSDKPHLRDIKYMGYSLRTARYRYTEWVKFDIKNFSPEWDYCIARELYDHHLDPEENYNLASKKELYKIMINLQMQLHSGWRHSLPKEFIQ